MGLCSAFGAGFFRARGRRAGATRAGRRSPRAAAARNSHHRALDPPRSDRPAGPRRVRTMCCIAIDEDDREMRVIVNARSGEILRMVPAATAARMPPRGGVATGPYERMDRYERERLLPATSHPTGYRYSARPPVIDDDDDDLPPEPAGAASAWERAGRSGPSGLRAAAAHRLRRSAAGHQGYAAGSGRGYRARHRSAAAVFRISAASVRLAGRDHSAARRCGSATTIRFAGRLHARARSRRHAAAAAGAFPAARRARAGQAEACQARGHGGGAETRTGAEAQAGDSGERGGAEAGCSCRCCSGCFAGIAGDQAEVPKTEASKSEAPAAAAPEPKPAAEQKPADSSVPH